MSLVIAAPAPITIPVAGGGRFPVRRIYCVGRNYEEHAKEMGFTGREPPFFFMKPADAIVNVAECTTGEIPYAAGTNNLHYEIELVAAIGVGGANIKAADAMKHVWGYAVCLDMTRRDLQGVSKKEGRPWEIGKAFDHSAPIGPIHPVEKVGHFEKGLIQLSVNGEVKQKSDLDKMIWSVAEQIAKLSEAFELFPGDVIYSGTPENVGPVVKGDVIVVTIDKLPDLSIKIV